ncbi:sorting and assembly machinery component 50 [Phlyctochytrium planicorne]|nr:sorting and assembly machinery component 50 [Phlyctochytrium planicorne]
MDPYRVVEEAAAREFHVNAVLVEGAKLTGNSLLQTNIGEILNAKTFGDILGESQAAASRLARLGVFKNVGIKIDVADESDGRDLDVTLVLDELPQIFARTATSFGTNEGDVTMSVNLRNSFGRAETVEGSMSYGMETNSSMEKPNVVPSQTGSSFNFIYNQPIDADPSKRFECRAFKNVRNQSLYSSHKEHLIGISTGVKLLSGPFAVHEFCYTGVLRNVADFNRDASWSTRKDAGHSFKSSVSHSMTVDTRDDPLLPSRGYYIRTFEELSGLGGDVKHLKGETFGYSGRFGVLQGLIPQASSRINDRFFLGGPSSIRGFRQNGIGPKDQGDCIGGDMFFGGGLSLFTPLPYLADKPIRGHLFVNGGNIVKANPGSEDCMPFPNYYR